MISMKNSKKTRTKSSKIYEDLANLTLEDSGENSSEEKTDDDPVAADKCSPILGGQVYSQSLPSGMARHMTSGSTNNTTSMTTSSSATLSSTSSTITSTPVTSIIHETNCSCPYCYVRNRNKQKYKFSAKAASVRTTTNGKNLVSLPIS